MLVDEILSTIPIKDYNPQSIQKNHWHILGNIRDLIAEVEGVCPEQGRPPMFQKTDYQAEIGGVITRKNCANRGAAFRREVKRGYSRYFFVRIEGGRGIIV